MLGRLAQGASKIIKNYNPDSKGLQMFIISACLAGIPCRYNGESKLNKDIRRLVKDGEAILVCPEQLGGLTTPRQPSELKNGLVIDKDGKDVTYEFKKGAEIVLKIAKEYGCKRAILKARSPSCGSGEVYDGSFSSILVQGNGITAQLLIENGIKVITEDEL